MRKWHLLFLIFVASPIWAANDAILNWNCNTETDLAGYKVYQGEASRTYGTPVTVPINCTSGRVSYTKTGLPIGTSFFSVTAVNTSNLESGFSNEVSKTFSAPVTVTSINFTIQGMPTIAGFTNDIGSAFDSIRGFGWTAGVVDTRTRNTNPDPKLDSFAFSTAPATWELVVPNGNYLITTASGDALWAQGPHRVVVEGSVVVNNQLTNVNQFVTVTDSPVQVNDGRLTVVIGGGGGYTMLNYIVIKSTQPPASQAPGNPQNLTVQ